MLNGAYVLGRFFVPIVFIVSGVRQLLDIGPVVKMLDDYKLPLPEQIPQVLFGIPQYNALAYLILGIEVFCGLMVLFNAKPRWGALVLIVYAACTIFFVHHFWDMEGVAAATSQGQALQYLSIMGALLLIVGVPQLERRASS